MYAFTTYVALWLSDILVESSTGTRTRITFLSDINRTSAIRCCPTRELLLDLVQRYMVYCKFSWTRPGSTLCIWLQSQYILQHHAHLNHYATTLLALPLMHEVPKDSDIIVISSYALTTIYNLIWLTVSDLIWLIVSDLIWLTFLTGFDSVFIILFYLHFMHWSSIQVHYSSTITVRPEVVHHWTGCSQNNPTLKSWDITQFWELKLVLKRRW